MNYIKLAKQVHQTAKNKGWWENERPTDRIFALVASELYEAMEADREDRRATTEDFKGDVQVYKGSSHQYDPKISEDSAFKQVFEKQVKDTVEDELADAFIRCLDYLFYRHREYFEVSYKVNIDWKEDFASNIFSINKELCMYHIETATAMIISLAEHMDIDLEWHVKQKMKYNDLRSYKHGGKKY